MLLQNLIAQQQQAYAQIQSQIEQLQEQQRQVQAYLEQLGSVESQMLGAAQVVEEAITSINQVCPGELDNYKQLIMSLFNVIPQLEAGKLTNPEGDLTEENITSEVEVPSLEVKAESDSPDNDPDNDPTPPGNSDNTEDSIDVEAEVVQQPVLTLIKGAVTSLSYQQIKEVMHDYKLETKGKAIKLKDTFIGYCERRTEQQQQGIWEYLTNLVPDLATAA